MPAKEVALVIEQRYSARGGWQVTGLVRTGASTFVAALRTALASAWDAATAREYRVTPFLLTGVVGARPTASYLRVLRLTPEEHRVLAGGVVVKEPPCTSS